jgi:hypothetical protein
VTTLCVGTRTGERKGLARIVHVSKIESLSLIQLTWGSTYWPFEAQLLPRVCKCSQLFVDGSQSSRNFDTVLKIQNGSYLRRRTIKVDCLFMFSGFVIGDVIRVSGFISLD